MAGEKRIFTVMVIPEKTSKTYSFRLRRGFLYVLGALCVFLLGSYVYLLGVHHKMSSKARRAELLELENAVLRDQTLKVADLRRELTGLQNIRQRLYELAGAPQQSNALQGVEENTERGASLLAVAKRPSDASIPSPMSPEAAMEESIPVPLWRTPSLWPVRGWVTAEFEEILPGRERRHTGLDIAAPLGTPILAAAAGKVIYSGWDKDLGLVAIIDHQNGLSTLYGHCSQVLLDVDGLVTQGQPIALVGNTGRSSAPHLHFEIRNEGIVIDPREYLGP